MVYAVYLHINCLKDERDNGLEWKSANVYFDGGDVNAIRSVSSVRELAQIHGWFYHNPDYPPYV